MDINQPNQANKDLGTQNPPNIPVSPPTSTPPPAAPPVPSSPPPAPPSTPPAPPAPPEPPKSNIPLQQPSEHNVGVGTPNIGVEEKQIPIHTPEPPQSMSAMPPAPPKSEPEITPPIKAESQDTGYQIEVADYGIPSANPPLEKPIDNPNTQPVQVKNYQNQNPQNPPQPPVKANSFNTPLTIFIVLALILGSAGGFFGFRYLDQSKTAASTETTPTATTSPSLDINTWQTYNSTGEKFSIKYPTGWFTNTTADGADSLIFASNKESLEGTPTGFKVEINFQNANGQTLKKWVEANTATTGEKKAAKVITVSGQTAYQQELSKNGSKVATYIERPSKIMVVTYSAPENIFGDGGQWYNNFINSIKLI
ncbi:MAG: photosystem II reaction center PsbP family protein [Patescibacteria group bacterium]|nr:photosystem II reaction center PsbP family protein [Patescibacteria group bacterium]